MLSNKGYIVDDAIFELIENSVNNPTQLETIFNNVTINLNHIVNKNGYPLLHYFCEKGDLASVTVLLNLNTLEINHLAELHDQQVYSPLLLAALSDAEHADEIAILLFTNGAQIDTLIINSSIVKKRNKFIEHIIKTDPENQINTLGLMIFVMASSYKNAEIEQLFDKNRLLNIFLTDPEKRQHLDEYLIFCCKNNLPTFIEIALKSRIRC